MQIHRIFPKKGNIIVVHSMHVNIYLFFQEIILLLHTHTFFSRNYSFSRTLLRDSKQNKYRQIFLQQNLQIYLSLSIISICWFYHSSFICDVVFRRPTLHMQLE